MPCSIIDSINSLYTAYAALQARCCDSSTPLTPDQCAMQAVKSVYQATYDLVANETCGTLTASASAQDPSEPTGCLNGDWMAQCEAWISGLTCEPPVVCEPEQTCIACSASPGPFQMTGSLNAGLFTNASSLATSTTRWNEALGKWEGVFVVYYPEGYENVEYIWSSDAIDRCSPVGHYTNPGAPPPSWTFNDYDVEGFC